VSQDSTEQSNQYAQRKIRYKIFSLIGLLLLIISLGSCGVTTFIQINTSFEPTPTPIIGHGLTPTPGFSPTPSPTPGPPPTPPPTLTVNPTSLDPNSCTNGGSTWICSVSLAETSNSQGNANWTATSDLGGVIFMPLSGVLTPGHAITVIISNIPCQNGSFTFSGAEGETPAVTLWSCSLTPTSRSGLLENKISTPTPTPELPEHQVISDTTIPNIKVISAWPYMILNQSVDITVSLVTKPYLQLQLTAIASNEVNPTQVISALTPIGTPGVSISDAFGPNYEVIAEAQLFATAFKIQPDGKVTQTLDQHIVSFHWSVLPQEPGLQTIDVTIWGKWTSKNGGQLEERIIGQPRLSIDVAEKAANNVQFFTLGQITLGEIFLGFIGSALNVPWLLDFSRKRREERRRRQRLPSSTSVRPLKSRKKKRQR
jgi:hypothetical protein